MNEIFDLINEMSPYLLLGFFLAGLLHVFVPKAVYGKYLAGNSLRSVILSALFGVPLPLCSCGVIPTAASLRREGASKGATVSFLIATPQTGVDSIIATWSLLGLPFAIIRPVAAFVTAIAGGCIVNIANRNEEKNADSIIRAHESKNDERSIWKKLEEALRYAFVDMMEDIGKWLVIGLAVAGLITVLVPDSFFALFAGNSLLSMAIVLLFSIPMYLCATGSIPIAVALMLKGLSPGAALVLLMAGPASNMASILVIGKTLGKKTLVAYLLSITLGAILFGLGIDWLLPREWFMPTFVNSDMSCCHEATPWFKIICSAVMAILLVNALTLRLRHKRHHCSDSCCCHEDEEQCETEHARMFDIKGMNCNHCRTSVENAILSVEGVEEAHVSLKTGIAEVKGEAKDEEIIKAVDSIGFSASVKS